MILAFKMNPIYKQIGYNALKCKNSWYHLYYHYTNDDFKRLGLGETILIDSHLFRMGYAVECCHIYKFGLSYQLETLCFDCIEQQRKRAHYQMIYKGKLMIKSYFYKLFLLRHKLVRDVLYTIGLLYVNQCK